MDVIKRSGKKESFDGEKIKKAILKAYVDAGESLEDNAQEINKMTMQVSEWARKRGEGVRTGDIKEKILEILDDDEYNVSDAWRNFDRKYKSAGNQIELIT